MPEAVIALVGREHDFDGSIHGRLVNTKLGPHEWIPSREWEDILTVCGVLPFQNFSGRAFRFQVVASFRNGYEPHRSWTMATDFNSIFSWNTERLAILLSVKSVKSVVFSGHSFRS